MSARVFLARQNLEHSRQVRKMPGQGHSWFGGAPQQEKSSGKQSVKGGSENTLEQRPSIFLASPGGMVQTTGTIVRLCYVVMGGGSVIGPAVRDCPWKHRPHAMLLAAAPPVT